MTSRAHSLVAAVVVVVVALWTGTGACGEGMGSAAGELQKIYQTLGEHGVRPALIYEDDGFVNMSGGVRRGTTYFDNLSLQLTLDMERLVSWRGATIFLYGLGIHVGQPDDFAGDAQGV